MCVRKHAVTMVHTQHSVTASSEMNSLCMSDRKRSLTRAGTARGHPTNTYLVGRSPGETCNGRHAGSTLRLQDTLNMKNLTPHTC